MKQATTRQHHSRLSARGMGRRATLGFISVLVLASGVSGCTAAPTSAPTTAAPTVSAAPTAAPTVTLAPTQKHCVIGAEPNAQTPLADVWGILPLAIDGDSMEPTGEMVTLTRDARGYTSPDDCELGGIVPQGQLSTDVASYPVLDRTESWVLVATPARQSLPSAGRTVNHPALWVNADAVASSTQALVATVSLSAMSVTLPDGSTLPLQAAGTGDLGSTPTGWASIASRYQATESASSHCYSEQTSVLSIHSTELDEFAGAPSVIALHDFSAECVAATGYDAVSPGCLILSTADLATLNAALPVGSLIRINS